MFICDREYWKDYLPISLKDVELFYDIPLLTYIDIQISRKYRSIKIALMGLHRDETFFIKISNQDILDGDHRSYLERVILDTCAEKWPLKESFKYFYEGKLIKIIAPKRVGNIYPDWSAVFQAARIAIHKTNKENINNVDSLFVSLYNEALKINIHEFRIKYREIRKITSTERLLEISNVPKDVERFVQRLQLVSIEREPENINKNTFDFIRMRISIPTKAHFPNRKEFIENNMQWFITLCLNKLNGSSRFTRFGVPVTCLSLKNVTVTCVNEIEFLFELKDELRSIITS